MSMIVGAEEPACQGPVLGQPVHCGCMHGGNQEPGGMYVRISATCMRHDHHQYVLAIYIWMFR